MIKKRLYDAEYHKKYYLENKAKILERKKSYHQNNKDKLNKKRRYYYRENRDKFNAKQEIYFNKNRNKINRRKNNHQKIKRKYDSEYRILTSLRTLLYFALKKYSISGKIHKSSKYGIDYQKIIEHLIPFPEDLTLYHIDHIRPLCSFDLNDPEEIKRAFAPENHQWLTIKENLSKGGRYTPTV